VRTLGVSFDNAASNGKKWRYGVNDLPPSSDYSVADHYAFPRPHYVNVGAPLAPADRNILPDLFNAQLIEQGPPTARLLEATSPIPAESMLLKLAGFGSSTRRSFGRGHEEPWPHPLPTPGPDLRELEARFGKLSKRLTDELRRWWREPNGVTLRIRVAGSPHLNSYACTWEATTPTGVPLHGAGFRWFVTFMIEILYARALANELQSLFVFDEPGGPLHPAAQRATVRLLDELARSTSSQVIYSTHSPFMLDWSFPQRIRLFDRHFESGRGIIINKPYAPGGLQSVWDPLRDAIGVSLGDVTLVGERNVFVEGISDQIILANASEYARQTGRPHLDFPGVSVVPFGSDLRVLKRLLEESERLGARSAVLVDADDQGGRWSDTVRVVVFPRSV
jgi:hypothetical protein